MLYSASSENLKIQALFPSSYLEVFLGNTFAFDVLAGQVIEVHAEHLRVAQQVYDGVESVGDAKQVSVEFRTVGIIDFDSFEQRPGARVVLEEAATEAAAAAATVASFAALAYSHEESGG